MRMLNWRTGFLAVLLIAAAWFSIKIPDVPARVVTAEVVSLEDGEGGWRTITVRFDDGRIQAIETLAPFFYRPGYKVKVAVYDRLLLPDHYDLVSDSKAQSLS
ncbi:hypothetical protein [Kordiimonas sp.]|uniref:hypothetical protein n=1 Tax=Kordiimonas sp. TaxID=1970157 RepID=UPI003A950516